MTAPPERWQRNKPDRREDALAASMAAILGAAVGVVTFYFARLMLARDPLASELAPTEDPPAPEDPAAPEDPSAPDLGDEESTEQEIVSGRTPRRLSTGRRKSP